MGKFVMLKQMLQLSMFFNLLLLPRFVFGNDSMQNDNDIIPCDDQTDNEDAKIISLLESLPVDLLERLQAGQASDQDLEILIDLGQNRYKIKLAYEPIILLKSVLRSIACSRHL